MNDLRTWCEHHATDPAMLEGMLVPCLLAWRNRQALPPYFGRDRLATAYDDQQRIGWGCFLEGSLAKTWLPVQAAYLISQGSMKKNQKPGQAVLSDSSGMWRFKCGSTKIPGNTINLTLKIAANILSWITRWNRLSVVVLPRF
jgi:hypothetical protein